MTPDKVCAKLEAFHDGELPLIEACSVAAHIGGCPACREELAHLSAMDKILKSRVATADIAPVVMKRVAALDSGEVRHVRASAGWWKVPTLALASCAVYVFCVETGLLPTSQSQLLVALTAHKEAEKFSTMIFGGVEMDSKQLLVVLLEGGEK